MRLWKCSRYYFDEDAPAVYDLLTHQSSVNYYLQSCLSRKLFGLLLEQPNVWSTKNGGYTLII